MYIFKFKMFHQEASVETIKLIVIFIARWSVCFVLLKYRKVECPIVWWCHELEKCNPYHYKQQSLPVFETLSLEIFRSVSLRGTLHLTRRLFKTYHKIITVSFRHRNRLHTKIEIEISLTFHRNNKTPCQQCNIRRINMCRANYYVVERCKYRKRLLQYNNITHISIGDVFISVIR